jgi:hypothetical protein
MEATTLETPLRDYINYAQLLFKRNNTQTTNTVHDHFRMTIDGLKCNVDIDVHQHYNRFCINTIRVDLNDEGDEWCLYVKNSGNREKDSLLKQKYNTKYTINELAGYLMRLSGLIKHLKFDKFTGRFINPTDPTYVSQLEVATVRHSIFGEIVDEIINCCVCLEPTTTVTSCKHNLCASCWIKIDKLRCPVCRRSIRSVHMCPTCMANADEDEHIHEEENEEDYDT